MENRIKRSCWNAYGYACERSESENLEIQSKDLDLKMVHVLNFSADLNLVFAKSFMHSFGAMLDFTSSEIWWLMLQCSLSDCCRMIRCFPFWWDVIYRDISCKKVLQLANQSSQVHFLAKSEMSWASPMKGGKGKRVWGHISPENWKKKMAKMCVSLIWKRISAVEKCAKWVHREIIFGRIINFTGT